MEHDVGKETGCETNTMSLVVGPSAAKDLASFAVRDYAVPCIRISKNTYLPRSV